jgi:hypothetical protein
MPILRTPDDRFDELPDFPYKPNYVDILGRRVHYLDEGRGEIVLARFGKMSLFVALAWPPRRLASALSAPRAGSCQKQ